MLTYLFLLTSLKKEKPEVFRHMGLQAAFLSEKACNHIYARFASRFCLGLQKTKTTDCSTRECEKCVAGGGKITYSELEGVVSV